ncbi:MAG: isoprenylcysteine carboxyl methyltransferase family protein [Alphaproteobacteria bacterium]
MSAPAIIVLLVAIQRLVELIYARANTKRLLAGGAQEYGAAHYPFIVLLHASWLASLVLIEPQTAINYWLIALFVALQAARIWVLATLGRRWTTRVIVLPGAPLVQTGAYRIFNHPNYLIVVAEIAVLPLAFGLWWIAAIFSILNAALLGYRIRIENAALAQAAS